jgi:hypothetical protein
MWSVGDFFKQNNAVEEEVLPNDASRNNVLFAG